MKLMFGVFLSLAIGAAVSTASGAIIISEVHSTGSASLEYGEDWFELTNTGATSVNITDWKIDDSSANSGLAAVLQGVTEIAPGQSVVFLEDGDVQAANFIAAWFGANPPSNFTIGYYVGSGLGFSSVGDAVNIYDAANNLVTSVSFGAATLGVSFDNSAGLSNTAISTLSSININGAFLAPNGEVGSPGAITAIPEPTSVALIGIAGVAGIAVRRNRNRKL